MPAVTKRRKTISRERVVDAIRRGIQDGELVPGQRLVETELAETLSAKRGVVRSALMDLVHEGMVEHIANRGSRVRIVGLPEALHIVEVRMVLESLCAARAAERMTDKDIVKLRALGQQLKERAESGDVAGYAELTHKLFEIYIVIADQPVAQEVLARLRARNIRHRFRLTYRPGRAKIALPYWMALIDALCTRNPRAAGVAIQRHAANVRDAMQSLREDRSDSSPLF